jgi:hypothetical protein
MLETKRSSFSVAREVAKFTPARLTPGVLLSFRSIRLAHAAQVMPVIGMINTLARRGGDGRCIAASSARFIGPNVCFVSCHRCPISFNQLLDNSLTKGKGRHRTWTPSLELLKADVN